MATKVSCGAGTPTWQARLVIRVVMRENSIMRSFPLVQSVRFPARLLGGITTSCVVVFAVLAGLVASRWPLLLAGDQAAEGAAHGDVLAQHWLLIAAKTATAIGSPVVVDVVAAVVVVVLLVLKCWRGAVVVALARVGELVCESLVKVLVARPRPALVDPVTSPSGYSFPSGHAGGSAAVYGALALLGVAVVARSARLMLVIGAALLIGAVAVSRVLLGVHYPSDIAAGVALGLAWVSGAALLVSLPRSALFRASVSHRSVPPQDGGNQ
jgi:membrane-associated phospholipid phosphatase